MKQRAHALGAPVEEYVRAAGIAKYRFMRGDRGEHANGWVRVNSIGLLGNKMVATKGFELLLTHPDHSQLMDAVHTFDVSDDSARFGTVGAREEDAAADWHQAAFSPTPTKKAAAASTRPRNPARGRRLSL